MLAEVWREHQKVRFLAVGIWNSLFGYTAFAVLYLLLQEHIHYLLIGLIAHVLSTINAFLCQRWLVFRATTPWWSAFARFNLVQLLVLCWGLSGLALTVEVMHLRPLLGQLLVMSVAVIGSYLMHRNYSFRPHSRPPY
jgi:putative flippase GtrA